MPAQAAKKEDAHRMEENFDRAMAIRRSVLGDDYVDAAMDNATPFTAPFQEFVTRWAWGEAWLDETLDPQTRSLLTVAVVTVLGQLNEVRLHVRGALRNGCTPEEIGAVLKHVAIYAGVAKAVAGIGIANEQIAEHAQDGRR
jgi:alkylhydroperoxidase/carboxymuconolactone decarboxylase family protein YurZ